MLHGEDRVRARPTIFQCIVPMFAEDIRLLGKTLFTGSTGLAKLNPGATIGA